MRSAAGLTIWTNAAKVLRRLNVADEVISQRLDHREVSAPHLRGDVLDETRPGELGRRFGCPNLVVHRAELLRALASGSARSDDRRTRSWDSRRTQTA